MKQITFYLLMLLSFSLIAQDKLNQDIITGDLIEFMSQSSDDELIPINIMLTEKYPTSQLYSQISKISLSERREIVKSELKSFSETSQHNIRTYLSAKVVNNEVIHGHNFWITNVISCEATKAVINELSLRGDIDRIDHDEVRNMLFGDETDITDPPNSTRGTREITNNVIKVNAPAVWDLGFTGQGVVVAVLDVGVNYNHLDLADHMWEDPDYPNHGYDFAYNDNDPMDNHGHGTHCAGTVAGDGTAGSQTGMAPDATIMALKILNDNGGGQESDSWEGFEFAVDHGADIISFSVGWRHWQNPNRTTWRNTLENTLVAGVVASVAAGNEGGSPSNPDDVTTPGDCPPPWLNPDQTLQGGISACVCVGATDNNDNIASFSSRGPSDWESISPFNDYPFNPEMGLLRPDVSAPGVGIKSCNAFNINGYTNMSGTSMATPGVAGVMALLMSKVPGLDPQAIDIALETTSVDLGAPGKDNLYGAGRIDALEAINSLIEMFPPTSLQANTNQETGLSSLTWSHNLGQGFQYYKIYRNSVEIDTTSNMSYEDQLTEYGYYTYEVTAYYGNTDESDPAIKQTQWGSSTAEITPDSYTAIVQPEGTVQQTMIIKNTGVLELTYLLSPFFRDITVVEWVTVDPDNGIVAVGDSAIVTLTFSAEGYSTGTYTGTLTFATNDLNTPNHPIPVTMIVTDLQVTASASPSDICLGESTQLSAVTTGGSGSFTYSWTSVPEGFISTESEPVVVPSENTEYFVTVIDGAVTMDASTSITVFPLPVVDLGGDQVLCGETQYNLDAGNPGDTYLWSTSETTQTIVATGSGENMFWAEVTNTNGCSAIDTIYLNFASIPEINLGADTAVCGSTSITLDASNSGSTYLWSNNETTQTIIVDTLGFGYGEQDISVEVVNESGCYNLDGIYVVFVNCTGIEEHTSIDVRVYPNPASGIFNIELSSNANNPVNIKVVNVAGTTVYNLDNIYVSGTHTEKVDISNFADGNYTVVVISNGISTVQKIVLRK